MPKDVTEIDLGYYIEPNETELIYNNGTLIGKRTGSGTPKTTYYDMISGQYLAYSNPRWKVPKVTKEDLKLELAPGKFYTLSF
jgi:hypothetical protein